MTVTRFLIIMMLVACTGCASHICIKTEVYKGNDLVTKKTFRKQAGEMARQTGDTVAHLDRIIADPAGAAFGKMVADFKALLPDEVLGDPAEFASAYREAVTEMVLKPQKPLIDLVSREAEGLERAIVGGASDNDVRERLGLLQTHLQKLTDGTQSRLDQLRDTETQFYRDKASSEFSKGNKSSEQIAQSDRKLAKTTGLRVTNDTERTAAISDVQNQIDMEGLNVQKGIGAIISPVETLRTGLSETLMVPLGDPNIPIIVGSDTEKWGKYANDVSSTTFFGNSETAFKMEGLGEDHIKSVIFDPSEVTKVGLNVFSTTLRITAAAYGFPLPKTQESQEYSTADKETLSKPSIDAEVKVINSRGIIRGQRMEKYYWRVTDVGKKFNGADGSTASSDDQAELAALLECMADEIENPQTVKCGGKNGN